MHRDSFLPWLPSFYILLVNFKSQIQLEGRAIQRELHILEIQADASFLASNKSNCKVFHLGRNSFMNQCRMGAVGKQLYRKGPGCPSGQFEYESAVWPAAEVANSINKRAREVTFHKTSSEYCVQFWAPCGTRTILTYGRQSTRRAPKWS